jgi:Holliday junction DNA helicase RuvA
VIAWLQGTLLEKKVDEIVLNVGGVGYQVHVPLSTYYTLPENGSEVALLIYTHVREDQISLFGFKNEAEREWFKHLIRISGIGPRLAINILSGISSDDLKLAIASGDATRLRAIPGIGKKTAARMVVELKELYPSLAEGTTTTAPLPEDAATLFSDAISALTNLGFKPQEASKTVRKILSETESPLLKDVIKTALKSLQR